MKKFHPAIYCALAFAWTASATTAQPSSAEILRDAVYARDMAGVEKILANHQRAYNEGNRSSDDTRALYTVFDTTHPSVLRFVTEWVQRSPDSPFANAATFWALEKRSSFIRGEKYSRRTHPDALTEFSNLQRLAWEHATKAFALEPRLIAASDAIIAAANSRRQQKLAFTVVHEVMATDPNAGTLRHASFLTHPGWGGSWNDAEYLCETYAEVVPDPEPSPVLSCKIRAAYYYHQDQLDWAHGLLATDAFKHMETYRLRRIILKHHTATQQEAELAHELLTKDNAVYYENWHHQFDSTLATKYDLDFVAVDHHERRKPKLEKALELDPYNTNLIKLMLDPVFKYEKNSEGQWVGTIAWRPTPEDTLEYSRRLLVAAPYDPENWQNYETAFLAVVANDPTGDPQIGKMEPFQINTIVYSQHDPRIILHHLMEKTYIYDAYQQVLSGKLDKSYTAIFDGIEMDRDVVCPAIRAMKVHAHVCKGTTDQRCQVVPQFQEIFQIILNDAKKRGTCVKQRNTPGAMQTYSPVQVDLGVGRG